MTYTVNSTSTEERVQSAPERELRNALDDGSLTEIEIAWSDPFGHAQGKRIPASQFLNRALGTGFAFCEASLGWNTDGTVIDSLRLTNWGGGYPDVYAVPDFSTYQPLPWRPGSATSSPTSSRTTAVRRCWIPARCSRRSWHGWPRWASPPRSASSSSSICSTRRVAVPGRHPRLLAGERQRTRSDAQRPLRNVERIHGVWRASRPSTAPARSRRTWSTPTRWRPPTTRPGSSTPPRRWRAGTARSPASCPSRSPSTREARSTCIFRCGATTSPPSRRTTAPRTSSPCTPSRACSSTCRRSRCSARTRSTPTDGSLRTRSRPRP